MNKNNKGLKIYVTKEKLFDKDYHYVLSSNFNTEKEHISIPVELASIINSAIQKIVSKVGEIKNESPVSYKIVFNRSSCIENRSGMLVMKLDFTEDEIKAFYKALRSAQSGI